jgi:hypothetical protein
MQPLRQATWCVLLLALLTACDGNDSAPSDVVASGTIGPAGGSVTVPSGPLAGASISIPPGALASPVTVSFFEDLVTLTPGFTDVGPAVRIEPDGLPLALPALLTLPFDPAQVPPPTATGDYVVRYRLADGRVFDALPRQVDPSLGRVTADVLQFATWWVSVPDAIETRAYLPLGSGDVYEYDTGLRLTVAETRAEPNFLGVPLTKLTFATPFAFFAGLYLAGDAAGALSLLGEFEVAIDNRQERLDGPVLLLDAVETIGSRRESFYTFTGFVPYGGLVPVYLGAAHQVVRVVERTSVVTPAGSFDDVVQVEVTTERSDSRPRSSTGTLRLWLADGVGPVQVQVNQDTPHRLESAVVGGNPIGH